MSATEDVDTILCEQQLPFELTRLTSCSHPSDEARVASMLSGLLAGQHNHEAICPLMVQRRLVVPLHHEWISDRSFATG